MDSFYAACELLRHPELKGKPFIVGTHDQENKLRGVVETASYEAKKLGISSAMPVAFALRIKPDISYVESDHDYYDSMSARVMALLESYGMKTEVMSIDEAAIDLGGMDYAAAEELARAIKDRIRSETGLACTIGVCDGKTLAKIVCDSAKPDGLKLVKNEDIVDFLREKDVGAIPGVGKKTADRLAEMGIYTIGDFMKSNEAELSDKVGSFGRELYMLAKGQDKSKVIDVYEIQSIGRERTLASSTTNLDEVFKMLDTLADEVHAELVKQDMLFKTVTVKGRYEDFTEKLKSKSFANYSDSLETMKSASRSLIRTMLGNNKAFRKVGVKVSSLVNRKGQKTLTG
jgi:nucleotidyltransferase/DNA polymerase involved in DNA repair